MKVIWDRRKSNLTLNQCLNIEQLTRSGDSVNNWTIESVLGVNNDPDRQKYLDREGWENKKYQVYKSKSKMSRHQIKAIINQFEARVSKDSK